MTCTVHFHVPDNKKSTIATAHLTTAYALANVLFKTSADEYWNRSASADTIWAASYRQINCCKFQ